MLAFAPDAATLRRTARKIFAACTLVETADAIGVFVRMHFGSGPDMVMVARIVATRSLSRETYYEAPVLKPMAVPVGATGR